MSHRDTLISWLNDAYGLEEAVARNLERHVDDADTLPEVRSRFQMHLDQTRNHQEKVRLCLEHLGAKPSAIKSVIAGFAGMFPGLGKATADDDLVKDVLMDCAAEQFEIASYRSIITAARTLGEDYIADVCTEILEEEEAFASWLEDQVPVVTEEYLAHEIS